MPADAAQRVRVPVMNVAPDRLISQALVPVHLRGRDARHVGLGTVPGACHAERRQQLAMRQCVQRLRGAVLHSPAQQHEAQVAVADGSRNSSPELGQHGCPECPRVWLDSKIGPVPDQTRRMCQALPDGDL